jgi:hypothetical protein
MLGTTIAVFVVFAGDLTENPQTTPVPSTPAPTTQPASGGDLVGSKDRVSCRTTEKMDELRRDFEKHGFVSVNDFFSQNLRVFQQQSEHILKGGATGGPPGASSTYNHNYNIPDEFLLKKMTESPEFTAWVREVTGVPNLKLMEVDRSKGYELNVFSAKLNLYPPGGTSFQKHYDREVTKGEHQVAVVYTISSEGGAPMELALFSDKSGKGKVVKLLPGTLTVHHARTTLHEVRKPDMNNRRVAYLMQFVDGGVKKKSFSKTASYAEAALKTVYGSLKHAKTPVSAEKSTGRGGQIHLSPSSAPHDTYKKNLEAFQK